MAFTYVDPTTGKHIFDVAEANIVGRSADGQTVVEIFKDGALAGAGTYSDTQARNAIKTKTQIAALNTDSTLAEVIAALKA